MVKHKIYTVIESIFQVAFVEYIALVSMESINNGYVSKVFNLNALLVIVVGSGILMLLTQSFKKIEGISPYKDKIETQDVLNTILIVVITVMLINFNTNESGLFLFFAGLINLILIFLLSVI